jgi:hypothetical protein
MRFASFSFDLEPKRSSLKCGFLTFFTFSKSFVANVVSRGMWHVIPTKVIPTHYKAITKAPRQNTFRILSDNKQWNTMRNQRWTSPIYPQKIMFLYTWIASAVYVSRQSVKLHHTRAAKNRHKFPKMIINRENQYSMAKRNSLPRLSSDASPVWQWNCFSNVVCTFAQNIKWLLSAQWIGHFALSTRAYHTFSPSAQISCIFMNAQATCLWFALKRHVCGLVFFEARMCFWHGQR